MSKVPKSLVLARLAAKEADKRGSERKVAAVPDAFENVANGE